MCLTIEFSSTFNIVASTNLDRSMEMRVIKFEIKDKTLTRYLKAVHKTKCNNVISNLKYKQQS